MLKANPASRETGIGTPVWPGPTLVHPLSRNDVLSLGQKSVWTSFAVCDCSQVQDRESPCKCVCVAGGGKVMWIPNSSF